MPAAMFLDDSTSKSDHALQHTNLMDHCAQTPTGIPLETFNPGDLQCSQTTCASSPLKRNVTSNPHKPNVAKTTRVRQRVKFSPEFQPQQRVNNHTHTNNSLRFSRRTPTLCFDLTALATALFSTQPLSTTAQTTNLDVTMVTEKRNLAPTASSPLHDVTPTLNTTLADDVTAEEIESTSSLRFITALPQLISISTEVDTGIPPGGGYENDTVTGLPPGEKPPHLSGGSIAGIVSGCVAAVLLFGVLMLCFCYKQKSKRTFSKKKKKSSHHTALFDDGITLSYINCQFEPTKDPVDEMSSLDNDAYLKSLEQYMVNQTWSSPSPPNNRVISQLT